MTGMMILKMAVQTLVTLKRATHVLLMFLLDRSVSLHVRMDSSILSLRNVTMAMMLMRMDVLKIVTLKMGSTVIICLDILHNVIQNVMME